MSSCCVNATIISVGNSETGGEFAQAHRSYKPGDIVMQNAPLACILSALCMEEYCLRCMQPKAELEIVSKALLRCGKCKIAHYCSGSCQKLDWKYHKLECKSLPYLLNLVSMRQLDSTSVDEILLLLRTSDLILQNTSARECSLEMEDNSEVMNPVIKCGVSHFNALCHHQIPLQPVDQQIIEITTNLILSTQKSTISSKEIHDVLTHKLLQFHVNNFNILNSLQSTIGFGIYPSIAILNHSCVPNCILRYKNTTTHGPILQVIARKPIAVGDEITHCYMDQLTQNYKQKLQQNYHFTCTCPLCSWTISDIQSTFIALVTNYIESNKLLENPLILRDELKLLKERFPNATFNPQSLLSEFKRKESFVDILQLKKLNSEILMATKIESKLIQQFVKILQNQSYYGEFHVELYSQRGIALSHLLSIPDFANALVICKQLISFLVVANVNMANHPLLAVQLFTLGDLSSECESSTIALQYYDWCGKVMIKTLGQQCSLFDKLKASIEYCLQKPFEETDYLKNWIDDQSN